MKISLTTLFKIFILSVVAVAFGLVATSCGPPPEEAEPTQTTTREDNSHLEKSSVEAEHEIGVSPCPQPVSTVQVFCGKTENSCSADSAYILTTHAGLKCTFENGERWTSLSNNPKEGTKLNVEFTCSVAANIEEEFVCNFYKNGSKVDEQKLKVKVNVK